MDLESNQKALRRKLGKKKSKVQQIKEAYEKKIVASKNPSEFLPSFMKQMAAHKPTPTEALAVVAVIDTIKHNTSEAFDGATVAVASALRASDTMHIFGKCGVSAAKEILDDQKRLDDIEADLDKVHATLEEFRKEFEKIKTGNLERDGIAASHGEAIALIQAQLAFLKLPPPASAELSLSRNDEGDLSAMHRRWASAAAEDDEEVATDVSIMNESDLSALMGSAFEPAAASSLLLHSPKQETSFPSPPHSPKQKASSTPPRDSPEQEAWEPGPTESELKAFDRDLFPMNSSCPSALPGGWPSPMRSPSSSQGYSHLPAPIPELIDRISIFNVHGTIAAHRAVQLSGYNEGEEDFFNPRTL